MVASIGPSCFSCGKLSCIEIDGFPVCSECAKLTTVTPIKGAKDAAWVEIDAKETWTPGDRVVYTVGYVIARAVAVTFMVSLLLVAVKCVLLAWGWLKS